jgi:hypothetical protein
MRSLRAPIHIIAEKIEGPLSAPRTRPLVVVDQRDAYGPGLHRYNRAFLDFAGH